jgi:hypothetical protein
MEQPVTLFTLGDGVLQELFDRELERVLADILDLNTKPEEIRTINIKIAIKPDAARGFGMVGMSVASSLGKPKPVGAQIFFGRKEGKPFAVENVPKQSEMFDKLGPRPVVDFKTGEVAE